LAEGIRIAIGLAMQAPLTVTEPARLLAFLFANWSAMKRTKVRELLKSRRILVNGRTTTQSDHSLCPGDIVSVRHAQRDEPAGLLPSGLKIHFEDAAILVIDKPANLLTIASPAEPQKNAYYYLTEYVRRGNPDRRERVWIVHRLDRETSGLMVFARTFAAKRVLQARWDRAQKTYQAVVEGNLPSSSGVFDSHLDETNPFRVRSARPSGQTRRAITHYRVLKRTQRRTLVELTLKTGRRHQIRVQLADAGCPIVGDQKYHARTDPINRLALHSCALRLLHPETGKELCFASPLPREMGRLISD
jgi:23S rRNA pseudouridine1911/1915/1917 synthase